MAAAIASGLAVSDPLTLYEADGVTVVTTFSWPMDAGDGVPVERLDLAEGDVESNWAPAACGPTRSPRTWSISTSTTSSTTVPSR